MKRRLFAFGCLLLMLLQMTSCGKKELIDVSMIDEAFIAENTEMFYAPEHEHVLRYEKIEPLMEKSTTLYHSVKCYYGNCDYEEHQEGHTLIVTGDITEKPEMRENGYFYHRALVQCQYCELKPWLTLYVYCQSQTRDCKGDVCRFSLDWREVVCDMPYEIYYD